MESREDDEVLGINIPFVLLLISSMAELSGNEPSVLMETWALADKPASRNMILKRFFTDMFFMVIGLLIFQSLIVIVRFVFSGYQ